MIYLFLNKKTITLLSLTKTMMGQYNSSFFQKIHENELLQNGTIENTDIVASVIKEALTLARPKPVTEKEVYFILPQESFTFITIDVPSGISDMAIVPFIRDKVMAEHNIHLDSTLYDFVNVAQGDTRKILLYICNQDIYNRYAEVLNLLGLHISAAIPETLSYFTLFEKTLRAEKKETILYIHYKQKHSYGFLYNSLGLLEEKRILFDGDDFEQELKKTVEKIAKEHGSVNRLILSGQDADQFRQDLFTKKIGAWTNPLKKIIVTFYEEYLKQIIVAPDEPFPLLDLDTCLGAFIFESQRRKFVLAQKKGEVAKKSIKVSMPSIGIQKRDVVIFVFSFLFSFGAIFLFPKFGALFNDVAQKANAPQPTATVTEKPKPTATPTPSIDRKTVNIKILNGSGTKGLAGEVKSLLQEKGYTEIITANAQSFDVEKTTVEAKKDKQDAALVFIQDMAENITFTKNEITELDEDDSADIVVTLGADFEL